MIVNSNTPRRLPDSVRRRLEVTTALAWESLVETHVAQAGDFVALLGPRLGLEDALDRYFQELDLNEEMLSAVRPRVLAGLQQDEKPLASDADLALLASHADEGAGRDVEGWRRFRPDVVVREVRQRQRRHDETDRWIQLSVARAEEAAITTHVDNAIAFVALLDQYLPLDRAVQQYLAAVALSGGRAQATYQRAMAHLAEVHLPSPQP